MRDTHPRTETNNPPPPDTGQGFTFCTWLSAMNPPIALGRDPDAAEKHLHEALLHIFRDLSDLRSGGYEDRAREELARQKQAGLIWVIADSEARAFQVWRHWSALVPEEALRSWRLAFPLPPDTPEPLEPPRRPQTPSAVPLAWVHGGRSRVRGASRRRILIGQIIETLPYMDNGRLEVLARRMESMLWD